MDMKKYYHCNINKDITVSNDKLKYLRADLFKSKMHPYSILNHFKIKKFRKLFQSGFPEPAIVVSLNPLLIAAYSEDLDCVAILSYPRSLIKEYKLTISTRLLTLNTYKTGNRYDEDIIPGENPMGLWVGFTPNIAEFLSDDTEAINIKKKSIPEDYWGRVFELGLKYVDTYPSVNRVGAPLLSEKINIKI
ncbi:hypothetical protein [Clostridium sp. 'White wine YQ']|uniref:hypothetical protein n=1 Tax=Clostridium sp. 'White wine YQ' TaxID=3027474 RepID=UPI002365F2C6|nr:hypothetical protein [Clostridium sp. 'White wine YQ']MDD7794185.1 hypothetical protein [Clostridium sp. 'White wine YQ']